MIIQNVRCDWVFLLQPNKKGKYGVCALLPKGSPQLEQVEKEITRAIQKGISAGKFTEAAVKSQNFRRCLRDGDLEVETEERPKHYLGHMFFNASNAEQPGLVDEHCRPLMSKDKVYSGAYYNLDINFYPYVHPEGGRGIGAAVNNVMFVQDGERLDSRQSAEEAFADFVVTDDDDAELT
jgi:hypothetical protein